ncbi:hypothetical protein CONPUDRAFT_156110 [Coniophora puteana RWD-64-598 SS2]|uniref:Uncharacterized protein n=1 Tax=Coniophora puteana (strain RWD-64-598) TaxID=741705 RepID=A0A5M3MGN0_CONPW|nr:uncharacterized protein CONPUDRAFT_156110 [Coniophora puteana RWD-64-598 SS2]EIW78100.1 hypothetical protein CONPUDRAFT_156110 [Coniophora puteana RWD-64-598 SS2]
MAEGGDPPVRRQYPPLTSTQSFLVEHLLFFPSLTYERVFPLDEPKSSAGILPPVASRIPKPKGEATHIGCGGYTLREALTWSSDQYEGVKKHVQQLTKKHLNVHETFSTQKTEDLAKVFAEVDHFPIINRFLADTSHLQAKEVYAELDQYEGDWVVSDFLRIYLKNSKARKKAGR